MSIWKPSKAVSTSKKNSSQSRRHISKPFSNVIPTRAATLPYFAPYRPLLRFCENCLIQIELYPSIPFHSNPSANLTIMPGKTLTTWQHPLISITKKLHLSQFLSSAWNVLNQTDQHASKRARLGHVGPRFPKEMSALVHGTRRRVPTFGGCTWHVGESQIGCGWDFRPL